MQLRSSLPQALTALWNRLTEPLPSVTDAEQRRLSKLVASLMIGMALVVLIVFPLRYLSTPTTNQVGLRVTFSLGSAVVVLVAYWLSRTGQYRRAAGLTIAYGSLVVFAASLRLPEGGARSLYYLFVMTLFASLFFGTRVAISVFAAHVVGMLLAPMLSDNITLAEVVEGPVYFNTLLLLITVMFAYHREQLEQVRKALLSVNEERYRAISELMSDYAFSFRVDTKGKLQIEWVTDSFKRVTGYEWSEIEAKDLLALYHPDDQERVANDLNAVLRGEAVSAEYRIVTKHGETRWIHLERLPVWDEAQQRVVRFLGVSEDVTESKLADEALAKSEGRYRAVFEGANIGIIIADRNGLTLSVNPVLRTLLGYTEDELRTMRFSQFTHAEDVPGNLELFNKLVSGEINGYQLEKRYVRKNGESVWVRLNVSWFPGNPGEDLVIATVEDISERKRAETALLESERLRVALEKEQELGVLRSQLMVTISHEFRTPLATIQTATELLDRYFERIPAEQRHERLQTIQVQVNRLTEMLKDISLVTQQSLHKFELRREPTHLPTLCRSIVKELQQTLGRDHKFSLNLDESIPEALIDTRLIHRVMVNLISNALKYSPVDSEIRICAQRDGDEVVVEVQDQGIGIAPEDLEHIFDAFFRGSNTDGISGTGLGLNIVKDAVDLHGGQITVSSMLGLGTTFTVRLPLEIARQTQDA